MVLLDLPSQALVLLKYNGHLSIVIVLKLLHSFPQGPHLQALAYVSTQRDGWWQSCWHLASMQVLIF